MDSENYYEMMDQLHEITLGKIAEMYGPDTKIIPFILGLLKSKSKVPIEILQEIKEELDKKSLLEQHSEFYPRAKQQENKGKKSAMVLLLKKMLEKLNEYNNIKDLAEIEKEQICKEIYTYFKENIISHENIINILNVEEGETNQIDELSDKIMSQEVVKEIINKRKKGGSMKKRNRIQKKSRISKKKLI